MPSQTTTRMQESMRQLDEVSRTAQELRVASNGRWRSPGSATSSLATTRR